MIWRILLIAFLLSFEAHTIARAEWNWHKAEPQALTWKGDALLAVGEVIFQNEVVNREDFTSLDKRNLSESLIAKIEQKGVLLSDHCTVSVKVEGRKWRITDEVNKSEYALVHEKGAPHAYLDMYRLEVVHATRIQSALKRGKRIRLKHAVVEGGLRLSGNLKIPEVYFVNTFFTKETMFQNVDFSGVADFSGSHFFGLAVFQNVKFMNEARFNGTFFAGSGRFRQTVFGNIADFSDSEFSQSAHFRDTRLAKTTHFDRANFSGQVDFDVTFPESADGTIDFTHAKFLRTVSFARKIFPPKTVFANTDFPKTTEVDFISVVFPGSTSFRNSEFPGGVNFRGARFKGPADFVDAEFSKKAVFSNTIFESETAFSYAQFSGDVDFTTAAFWSNVRFAFATFSNVTSEVSFNGARFGKRADFSYSSIPKVSFSSYIPRNEHLFDIGYEHHENLDRKELSRELKNKFLSDRPKIDLSPKTEIVIIEKKSKWLLKDNDNLETYSIVKDASKSPDDKNEDPKLKVYRVRKDTLIHTLNLIGCEYDYLDIHSRMIQNYDFDETAFDRFLMNQKARNHQPYEYQQVILERKRFQRSQKGFLARWFETVLFDWPTNYGTARIPWGLFAYAIICVLSFGVLYLIDPNALMFVKADGSVDNTRKDPNRLEILWFSLNTFIPAIEFFNATNWRPKYDAMFPWGRIRYATVATFERILGWAMIPSLLSYLKPEAFL